MTANRPAEDQTPYLHLSLLVCTLVRAEIHSFHHLRNHQHRSRQQQISSVVIVGIVLANIVIIIVFLSPSLVYYLIVVFLLRLIVDFNCIAF